MSKSNYNEKNSDDKKFIDIQLRSAFLQRNSKLENETVMGRINIKFER